VSSGTSAATGLRRSAKGRLQVHLEITNGEAKRCGDLPAARLTAWSRDGLAQGSRENWPRRSVVHLLDDRQSRSTRWSARAQEPESGSPALAPPAGQCVVMPGGRGLRRFGLTTELCVRSRPLMPCRLRFACCSGRPFSCASSVQMLGPPPPRRGSAIGGTHPRPADFLAVRGQAGPAGLCATGKVAIAALGVRRPEERPALKKFLAREPWAVMRPPLLPLGARNAGQPRAAQPVMAASAPADRKFLELSGRGAARC